MTETSEIKGNAWAISLPKTRIHTLEQLIEYCKVDLSVWEVERFIVNKWEVGIVPRTTRDGEGGWQRPSTQPIVEPLFQVKAFLKKKPNVVEAKREIGELKELAKKRMPLRLRGSGRGNRHARESGNPSGNMLELNIPDPHFGKLAWGAETGDANYDTKIARKVFVLAVEGLLARVAPYRFELVLLVIGNDLFNSDDLESRTTKGTQVSTDVRYHKTFATVRSMMIEIVERIRKVAPVKVVVVPGNHDRLSSWHLGDSLECYFHGCPDVEIDNAPRYYKYHSFGSVMLMFTHGDKGRRADYPLLMATEEPEMFGKAKFREAHTGHTHQTKLEEKHGVRVRILSALCPADDWHAENALVGNLRSAEAFIWNGVQGLIGTALWTDRSMWGARRRN